MRESDTKIFGTKMSGRIPERKKASESISITLSELEVNFTMAYSLVDDLKAIIFDIPKVDEKRNITNS